MKPFRLLVVILSATLASCATRNGIVAPAVFSLEEAADSIPVPFGKTVTVDRLLLTFADVTEDSRCPTSVVCVWAGDAIVSTSVTLTCTRSTPPCSVPELLLTLHTSLEPRTGTYAGMEIRLVALTPAPVTSGPIRKASYVAWFRVRAATS